MSHISANKHNNDSLHLPQLPFLLQYQQRKPKRGKSMTQSYSDQGKLTSGKVHAGQPYLRPGYTRQVTNPIEQLKSKPCIVALPLTKDSRQLTRVPIEYLEGDEVVGRVLQRGYAPKDSSFFLRTVKGNLHAALKVASKEYWLFMREDTNTHGLRQWFHFEVIAARSITLTLRIYRFSKRNSLYKKGMRPFLKTEHSEWQQGGDNIRYVFDESQKCYYLQFECTIKEKTPTLIATLPSYTHSQLMRYVDSLSKQPSVRCQIIGSSLAGLQIPAFSIRSRRTQPLQEAIVVLSRTHPGETVSNFTVEGIVEKALNNQAFMTKYALFIIPMLNPDGVFMGNHRTGVLGRDLNRHFGTNSKDFFPQLTCVQSYIQKIQEKYKIMLIIDLHGHSSKKNTFAFGRQCDVDDNGFLASRVFVKVLSQWWPWFKLENSEFEDARTKSHTGRVYLGRRFNTEAVTLEQSYGLTDQGATSIPHWRAFGHAIIDALIAQVKYRDQSSMRRLLAVEIAAEITKKQQKQQIEQQLHWKKQLSKLHQSKEKYKLYQQPSQRVQKTQIIPIIQPLLSKQLFIREKQKDTKIQQKQTYMHVMEDRKYIDEFFKFRLGKDVEEQQYQPEFETIVESSSESSGDEAKELSQNELLQLQKKIQLVGCLRESSPRETLPISACELALDKKSESERLHHNNQSTGSRGVKLKPRARARANQRYQGDLSWLSERECKNPLLWK